MMVFLTELHLLLKIVQDNNDLHVLIPNSHQHYINYIKLGLTKLKLVTEKCRTGFSMRLRFVSAHALTCAKFVVDKSQ